ncbi:hypothetical protein K461DRAFT_36409 [Myriangium duriaei CBS 260.36]|uniref:ATP-grasp domain-containing protein n=1 Tax=Myriangium duriaei CBS 260.36 TaxID=1168546 RepID=A0A9P4IW55_9PEZI|nr:hypothetical protein K461DRAFT_36409 [Myriangium duriaei CBS 260.36]
MPLILFDLESDPNEMSYQEQRTNGNMRRPHQEDAYRTFSRLCPQQRPKLAFVQEASDILLQIKQRIVVMSPMDCLLRLPHLVDPEVHYSLHSKRSLALSDLPTPSTEVIDTILGPDQVSDELTVDTEVQRMLSCVRIHHLPLVLKAPVSAGSFGTFIVRTREERETILKDLEKHLKKMIGEINTTNSHMKPCCLLVQDFVPGDAVALSLFVTKSGKAIYNACCTQLFDAKGDWAGAFCDYEKQDSLEVKYAKIGAQLVKYVHEVGYYGPIGVDIMTDGGGLQLVIDMNIRVAGSHALGALKSHFLTRGMDMASTLCPLMLNLTRDQFDANFTNELCTGSLVVNAWVHMRGGQTSMVAVTLGASDQESLSEFVKRVRAYEVGT